MFQSGHPNYCCGTCFETYAEEHSDQCDPGLGDVGDSAACAAVRLVGHTHEDIDAAFSFMMSPSQHVRAVAARASNPQEP